MIEHLLAARVRISSAAIALEHVLDHQSEAQRDAAFDLAYPDIRAALLRALIEIATAKGDLKVTNKDLAAVLAVARAMPSLHTLATSLADRATEGRDTLQRVASDLEAEAHLHIKDGGDPDEVTPTEALGLLADALDALAAAATVFTSQCGALTNDLDAVIYDI